MPKKEFCFFLLPQEPLRSQLADIIGKLAATYGVTPFIPHMTVYAGASDKEEAIQISEKIIKKFSAIELEPEKIDFTPLFFKTAFIQFHKSPWVEEMCEMIRGAMNNPSVYTLNPHLSVIYKKMPEAEQKKLCANILLPQGPYKFTTLHVIEAMIEETQECVLGWQTIFEADLQNAGYSA